MITASTDWELLEKQTIRRIETIFLEKLSVRIGSPDADLFQVGILDSMTLVDLILHLEHAFHLRLPLEDIELDSFRSVRNIAKLLTDRKWSGIDERLIRYQVAGE